MAFTTTPYCALADVKLFLGKNNATDDAFIQALIPQAQADLDGVLGYSFQTDGSVGSPASRTYSGNDIDQLLIDRCMQVTQVLETNYAVAYGAFGVVTNQPLSPVDITADCVLGPDPNVLPGFLLQRLSGFVFYKGRNNYTVKGIFGVTSIPADISRACLLLTIHYFKLRDASYSQTLPQSGPQGYAMRYRRDWPQDVCDIISRYTRRSFFTTGQ